MVVAKLLFMLYLDVCASIFTIELISFCCGKVDKYISNRKKLKELKDKTITLADKVEDNINSLEDSPSIEEFRQMIKKDSEEFRECARTFMEDSNKYIEECRKLVELNDKHIEKYKELKLKEV